MEHTSWWNEKNQQTQAPDRHSGVVETHPAIDQERDRIDFSSLSCSSFLPTTQWESPILEMSQNLQQTLRKYDYYIRNDR